MSPNDVLYCVKKSYFTKSLNKILLFLHKLQVTFHVTLKHLICIYKTCLESNKHTSCATHDVITLRHTTHLSLLSLSHTHTHTHTPHTPHNYNLHVIICPTFLQQAINNSERYATYEKLPKTPEARYHGKKIWFKMNAEQMSTDDTQ